jgi:hypothetical protein
MMLMVEQAIQQRENGKVTAQAGGLKILQAGIRTISGRR